MWVKKSGLCEETHANMANPHPCNGGEAVIVGIWESLHFCYRLKSRTFNWHFKINLLLQGNSLLACLTALPNI
jgi:hypothetical protein